MKEPMISREHFTRILDFSDLSITLLACISPTEFIAFPQHETIQTQNYSNQEIKHLRFKLVEILMVEEQNLLQLWKLFRFTYQKFIYSISQTLNLGYCCAIMHSYITKSMKVREEN
jgi:hypothetical protein